MALPLPKPDEGVFNRRHLDHQSNDQGSSPWRTAKVLATLSHSSVKVKSAAHVEEIAVASHVPAPVPGQTVLIAGGHGIPSLVIAAYPLGLEQQAPLLPNEESLIQFDEKSGTLCIHANKLKLQGVGSVELHCGDAVLRLNAQGEIFTHAQTITQSAIGAHRIEGASVDIN